MTLGGGEDGRKWGFEALCGGNGELGEELRQLLGEWERMSEGMERLGPKQGPLSLQLKERYGDSVDPEISLSQEEEKEGQERSIEAEESRAQRRRRAEQRRGEGNGSGSGSRSGSGSGSRSRADLIRSEQSRAEE